MRQPMGLEDDLMKISRLRSATAAKSVWRLRAIAPSVWKSKATKTLTSGQIATICLALGQAGEKNDYFVASEADGSMLIKGEKPRQF